MFFLSLNISVKMGFSNSVVKILVKVNDHVFCVVYLDFWGPLTCKQTSAVAICFKFVQNVFQQPISV